MPSRHGRYFARGRTGRGPGAVDHSTSAAPARRFGVRRGGVAHRSRPVGPFRRGTGDDLSRRLVMGLGFFTVAGLAAVVYAIIDHIIVKTSLFLTGGLIGTPAVRADTHRPL